MTKFSDAAAGSVKGLTGKEETIEEILTRWLGWEIKPISTVMDGEGPIQRYFFRQGVLMGLQHFVQHPICVMSESAWSDLGMWDQSDLGVEQEDVLGIINGHRTIMIGDMTIVRPVEAIDVLDVWEKVEDNDRLLVDDRHNHPLKKGARLVSTRMYFVPRNGFYEDIGDADYGGSCIEVSYK